MPEIIVIRWTPFALRSLDEIYNFIVQEARSTSPAEKFIGKVFNRTDQLKYFPLSGQEEVFLAQKGIKCHYLVEGNYKIIYEYMDDKKLIVILDVFNTSRNPENILKR